jgi:hypothetical protein
MAQVLFKQPVPLFASKNQKNNKRVILMRMLNHG